MGKYNDKTVKAFCDYIIEGENQKTAAEKLGISEVTICKWKKAYPEFLDFKVRKNLVAKGNGL